MSIITELFLFGTIEIIFEILTFGTLGYFLFRFLNINEKRWYLEILSLIALYIVIDQGYNSFFKKLNISIDNKEVLDFFDYDIQSLFTFDVYDFFIMTAEIGFGYWIGKLMYRKIKVIILKNG